MAQFHHSTTLAATLKAKQKLLNLPQNRLIADCKTRWNSCFDMITRILEQQLSVCAVLIENPTKSYLSLETKDIKLLEVLKVLLKPLKGLTVIMSGQSYSTLSIVLPSLHKLMNKHLVFDESDSKFVRDCKTAMLDDLEKRYQVGSQVKKVLVWLHFLTQASET